jgi:hypothetical protein
MWALLRSCRLASDNRSGMGRSRRVELTPEERDLIERNITEFVRGEAHEDRRKAAESAHALPLYLDWSACMALRPDGQIIWIDYDEPHQVRAVEDERERNIGLFKGSRRDPDLGFLAPVRPPDAIECPDCKGTGRLTFPAGQEHLAEKVVCSCGGVGWLPASSASSVRPPKSILSTVWRRRRLLGTMLMVVATLAALFGLSLLGFFPWSGLNCWQLDIDITSGRTRFTRHLFWMPVSSTESDSALTNALTPEDLAGEVADWHPVVTLSPGMHHSPHYRFHSATSQIRELEIGWEFGKMTPAARRETAQNVLRLWRRTGSYSRAGEYIQAVWERALEARKKGEVIDVKDLPSP